MPVRDDESSRTSEMPVSFPSPTSSAMRSRRLSGFTWYGSSVTIRLCRPLASSSTSTTARIVIDPRPVRCASAMPRLPMIVAPVGKSGPWTISRRAVKRSSVEASGLFSSHLAASVTSRRLWGGMLVAMPTAIPALPLTSRFGNLLGRTVGSRVRPS